jgi:uncharacterized protein (DUF885 family)
MEGLMRLAIRLLTLSICLFLFVPLDSASAQVDESSTNRLLKLFADDWEYQMEQSPTTASTLGDRRRNTRWEDVSIGAIEKRQQHRIATLAELKDIDRTKLSTADQLHYDLFLKEIENDIEV